LADNISTVIDLIHPSDGATAVLVGDTVFVLFDREISEKSLEGNFFVTGPETDTWSGPDLTKWDIGHDGADALQSPGLAGIVPGTFSFERINNGDTDEFTGVDVTGDGTLYRTKAIFTPSRPLPADTQFTVYLIGDEDDSDALQTGVKPKSIFDTEHIGSGSDDLEFIGDYSGQVSTDVVNVRIVESGVKRTATFEYWYDSDPLEIVGPVLSDTRVFLSNGVFVEFGVGTFSTDDEFTAVIKTVQPFIGTLSWGFETGSGSIQEIPESTSTTVIGNNLVPTTTVITDFKFVKIKPEDRATNLSIKTNQIILEFSKDLNPDTVTSERVKMFGLPVNGDPNVLSEREVYKNITVSGNKILVDF